MSKYKVRFNLGRGQHFMKWKVTSPEGCVDYYNPDDKTLVMYNCKLRNQSGTAHKIHEGANKTVCAWIEADEVEVYSDTFPVKYSEDLELSYNPRKSPQWRYYGELENIDNKEISVIFTSGRRLWDVAVVSTTDCDE
jgi:hypothetical protein